MRWKQKCAACSRTGDLRIFTEEEWLKNDEERKCNDCIPRACAICKKRKTRRMFSRTQWLSKDRPSICYDCDRKRCQQCNKRKGYKDFTSAIWELDEKSADLVCIECTNGKRKQGMWTCQNKTCRKRKPKEEFSIAIAEKGESIAGDAKRCNECMRRRLKELEDQQRQNLSHVQKQHRSAAGKP